MALSLSLRDRLVLPAVCAPMFLVSGPDLVREACKAGIMGALPCQNARSIEQFENWLENIRNELNRFSAEHPERRIGPLAVNIPTRMEADRTAAYLDICSRFGVQVIISAAGDPTELTKRAHGWGFLVFHDVTTLRFAEKAISAGVDGLTCIGAGGGGHSGNIGHLALIPRIRQIFDGTILMAGSISTGAAIRAAEVLGADLAYMGTRFIATQEAAVDAAYRDMLVQGSSSDLMFTGKVAGVPANWLVPSLERMGLDPANLPTPTRKGMGHGHLPEGVQPWKNLWSAGQGIDLIADAPRVADLVSRLRQEYVRACQVPDFSDVARLVEQALDSEVAE